MRSEPLTLKGCSRPSKWIERYSLTAHSRDCFFQCKASLLTMIFSIGATILGKNVLKLLWYISAFIVVRSSVTSMLGFMDMSLVDPEEWIREPVARRERKIAEAEMDDQKGEKGQGDIVAKATEANVSILRPDDAIVVTIEEINVLLENLQEVSFSVQVGP